MILYWLSSCSTLGLPRTINCSTPFLRFGRFYIPDQMCLRWFAAKGTQMTVSSPNATSVFIIIHPDRQCSTTSVIVHLQWQEGDVKVMTSSGTSKPSNGNYHLLEPKSPGTPTSLLLDSAKLNASLSRQRTGSLLSRSGVPIHFSVALDAQSTPPDTDETRVPRAINVLERGSEWVCTRCSQSADAWDARECGHDVFWTGGDIDYGGAMVLLMRARGGL
jgi:hypothetical protein